MQFHQIADLFPLMEGEQFRNFVADIKENGLINPIHIYEDQILDGRNRYNACVELGIEPQYIEYTGDDPVGFVISKNLHRRHLNAYQRAKIALKMKPEIAKRAKERQAHRQTAPGKTLLTKLSKALNTRKELAELANVSQGTIAKVEVIEEKATEQQKERLKEGDSSVSAVYKIIKREAEIEKQKNEIKTLKKPTNKFDLIVIDPPWEYGREYNPDTSRIASPYPEMSLDELRGLKLPAKDDCVLWLWATQKFIWDAKELLEIWGFDYKGMMVWDKEKMGMGHWLRMQCEFCLLGIKGNPLWKAKNIRDIIRESRREHSRKPEMFYKMVEDNFLGNKLDYFGRQKRGGWEIYGNETKL